MLKRLLLVMGLAIGLTAPAISWAQAAPHHVHAEQPAATAHESEESDHRLFEFKPDEAIWVIIIFVILLIILYPTAWKAVLGGLKAREDRIRSDLQNAEQERIKAETALKEYQAKLAAAQDEIRQTLAKAQADGEKVATNIRVHAQQEAEQIKERALREIEASRDQALSDIYSQAAELSTRIAEKILRRNLNAEDQQDLVRSSLDQLKTINRG